MKLIYLLLLLIVFSSSCRKEDQETVVHIRCVMPHNGQPIKGCRVTITEGKMKDDLFNVGFEPIQEFTGITDENGNATIRFHYMRKSKYQYKLAYDLSGLQQPNGMNQIQVEPPLGWATYMDKNKFDHNFTFNVLGFCGAHIKFENVNCFDSNDEMKYDAFNLSQHEGEGATGPDVFYGCGVVFDVSSSATNSLVTGKYVFKSEITRNGQTHLQYDTFNLQPGVMNEMIIDY